MTATILEGAAAAAVILAETAAGVGLLAAAGRKAILAAIQANRDPGSDWYAAAQAKLAGANGVEHRLIRLPPDAPGADLLASVRQVSADPALSGLIILTPLPAGASHLSLVEAMDPAKDAEGLHPANLGRLLVAGRADPAPCTAMAALTLIKTAIGNLAGKRCLVIGRSAAVGKPLALLLLSENATVTIAHTRSDLGFAMREAEVIVAAAGAAGSRWRAYEARWRAWRESGGDRPEPPDIEPLVRADMVRRGAIVVDVGDNYVPAGLGADGGPLLDAGGKPDMRYAGDVDFAKVKDIAGFITRPKGGVGPLTNAFLLRNVVRSALAANGIAIPGSGK
ncbi:MAG: bifunctional 5,10-methylenetetrahydrofolate dehydrogenase/5,10-methenyltetrahydrofolate cyclohydrolase [Planctomycetota bacterium]|jgi:methylenetetrahydrofolate dehydrogenase (NADP+)/methenyltetrahydrofolate cyclohydrolase|nr:bifunctional 5,10-methylenetetrahydrofolate dehydrogenase/5,10-methenyltetrahydrofolate cyclohydrolase [Planctomycetota bacterium]